MSKDLWQDGRRAWERLRGWQHDTPAATSGHPDDGDGALSALADVGSLRRLLDQAELVAVRTARRHGRSWAEIATKLGVTRQSAWERWRDLDGDIAPSPAAEPAQEVALDVQAAAAAELVGRAARQLRRRSTVVVPNVIGMSWPDARGVLHKSGLVGVGTDPDGPPLAAVAGPHRVVTDQSPESGARVPAGSPVTLWFERGGGAGVREPRRPQPGPRSAREMRTEPGAESSTVQSDEAVG